MVNTKREVQVLVTVALLAGGLLVVSAGAQEPVTLGLDSADGLTVDSPGGYTQAAHSFGSVPVRNGEPAQGLTVTLNADDGLVFYGPPTATGEGSVLVECAVWCSSSDVGLALVAMNLPDYSMMANLPANGSRYMDGWHTLWVILDPDDDTLMPGFQVVSTANPDIDVSTSVYVDEITVTPLQSLEPGQVLELLGMGVQPTPAPTPVAGYTVSGTVFEFPSGNGVMRGVEVTIDPLGLTDTTDLTGGGFRFEDVPDGEYTLTVSPECNPFGCWPVTAVVVSGADVTVNIYPEEVAPTPTPTIRPGEPITITGLVRELVSGNLITGALVTFGDISTQSGEDGSYSVVLPGPGTYTIHVEASGFHPYDSTQDLLGIQEMTVRLRVIDPTPTPSYTPTQTFTPTPTSTATPTPTATPVPDSVYGIVYDRETFQPVEGAVVTIEGVSTATDSNGTYRLNGVPNGEHVFQVSSEGYHDFNGSINVEGSVETNIALVRSVVISIDLLGLAYGATPLEMVLIQPGTFTMGSPEDEQGRWANNEWLPHDVAIPQPFYMGKYEVTQAQWKAAMGSNPATDLGRPSYGTGNDYPVYYVSWDDSQTFIEQLNSMGLGTFRLPTEAEWEYACRAGTDTRFSFGDALECSDEDHCAIMDDFMWWSGNSRDGSEEDGTRKVGRKLPNPFGLHDMHGNVDEWCSDWWEEPSTRDSQVDPQGPTSGSNRVFHGGDWFSGSPWARSAFRYRRLPDHRTYVIGLRLVREYEAGETIPTPRDTPTRTPTPTPTVTPTATPTFLPEFSVDILDLPEGALSLEMVPIPAGTFLMGSPNDELDRPADEEPQHQVTISNDFYIGKYEVTQAQWLAVMGELPSDFEGNNHPVHGGTWDMYQEFVRRLNHSGQGVFRLPTEAEWEYACRAGTTTRFSWGDDSSYSDFSDYAWSDGIHDVGQKLSNPWGLHDMSGNAAEWCQDYYDVYSISHLTDPVGPESGWTRVIRGGGGRSAARGGGTPYTARVNAGFRVVRERTPEVPTPTPVLPSITVPLPGHPWHARPMEMVLIPAGTFLMGSPDDELDRLLLEGPQHQVTLMHPFYLGRYEVTRAQWIAVMGSDPATGAKWEGIEPPVTEVSWNDCQEFVEKMDDLGSGTFRLPTEAEWEYACRAGTTTRFYWGDDENYQTIDDYAWYAGNSDDRIHDVGKKYSNPWGLYDMSGNVWEWCQDWYSEPYPSDHQIDPAGPLDPPSGPSAGVPGGPYRVSRGSGFHTDFSWYCRSAARNGTLPGNRVRSIGLRLVREYEGGGTEPTPTHTPASTPNGTPVPGEPEITVSLPGLQAGATSLEMVLVPAGTFAAGSPVGEQDRQTDESPQHEVTISQPFYIGVGEVTQAQWEALMGGNPSHHGGNPNHPVEQVSWIDCQDFIQALNALGQGTLRLPTEAEWEYACRAGTTTRYYWGEDPQDTRMSEYEWYFNNSSEQSQPVRQKLPNPWGLHDMGGNVVEWCLDWSGGYPSGSVIDPLGPASGTERVCRGSYFGSYGLGKCRSADRSLAAPGLTHKAIGFRVVREYEDGGTVPTPTNTPTLSPTITPTPTAIPSGRGFYLQAPSTASPGDQITIQIMVTDTSGGNGISAEAYWDSNYFGLVDGSPVNGDAASPSYGWSHADNRSDVTVGENPGVRFEALSFIGNLASGLGGGVVGSFVLRVKSSAPDGVTTIQLNPGNTSVFVDSVPSDAWHEPYVAITIER